jgi:hypothetical protein
MEHLSGEYKIREHIALLSSQVNAIYALKHNKGQRETQELIMGFKPTL